MEINELLTNDDAVSPVLGVILMVAITVILAAVIAAFVMGMGSSVKDAPKASISYDYDDGGDDKFGSSDTNDAVEISHDGGDTLENGNVDVLKNGNSVTPDSDWPDSEISAGDTLTVDESGASAEFQSGDEFSVVWTSDKNGQTATIASSEVP